jgi:3',5'-cyclic AMP phosphodiesterase CpdA
MNETKQLYVIHLSDVHFGPGHRFNPPVSPSGDRPKDQSYPTLLTKLSEDWKGEDPGCPLIVCITGDFAQSASYDEFLQAERFVRDLSETPILGSRPNLQSIFIVPGNHDVNFTSSDVGERWQQWTDFYNRLFGTTVKREHPWGYVQLLDRSEDLGAMILTLNSAVYVQRGVPDEDRGRVDLEQLALVEEALESIPKEKLQKSIRIALIHHHPVLIPALAEPSRGYDAVHDSGKLISILRRFGFHLLLHGHKHTPCSFTDDTNLAYQSDSDQPMLVVSGGSAGSMGLPNFPRSGNCYNRIVIKWHPAARQLRINVRTQGLSIFNENGSERLPNRWRWETLKLDDRFFWGGNNEPVPRVTEFQSFDMAGMDSEEEARRTEYQRTRGYMPVVEVMPSLKPTQAYEARLWLEPHGVNPESARAPVEVTWAAGPKFPVVTIKRAEDPLFCTRLNYWGPMLVQAKLVFEDGYTCLAHIYARLPRTY